MLLVCKPGHLSTVVTACELPDSISCCAMALAASTAPAGICYRVSCLLQVQAWMVYDHVCIWAGAELCIMLHGCDSLQPAEEVACCVA